MSTAIDLRSRRCVPLSGADALLRQDQINTLLGQVEHWTQYDRIIGRTFEFRNHYETLAFVNVEYTTHSINVLSMNDFICAAKVDALFRI